jgi:hypothetical protein
MQHPDSYAPQPPQRSWWGRNWKWVVPVGCLSPLLLCGGCVALIVGIVFGALKGSWAYSEGLELARHNKTVVEKLGEPLQADWLVTGSIRINGPTGDAQLNIPLVGPKNSGTLTVVAHKRADQWQFEQAEVQIKGDPARIDLLADEKKK